MDLPSPQSPLSISTKVEQEQRIAALAQQLRETQAELAGAIANLAQQDKQFREVLAERDRLIFEQRLQIDEALNKPSPKQDRVALAGIVFVLTGLLLLLGTGRISVKDGAIALESKEIPESVTLAVVGALLSAAGLTAAKN